jgi:hypothetical protein
VRLVVPADYAAGARLLWIGCSRREGGRGLSQLQKQPLYQDRERRAWPGQGSCGRPEHERPFGWRYSWSPSIRERACPARSD